MHARCAGKPQLIRVWVTRDEVGGTMVGDWGSVGWGRAGLTETPQLEECVNLCQKSAVEEWLAGGYGIPPSTKGGCGGPPPENFLNLLHRKRVLSPSSKSNDDFWKLNICGSLFGFIHLQSIFTTKWCVFGFRYEKFCEG